MTRLTSTLLVGLVLAAVLAVAGSTVHVPFVALGEGPTFDVLGAVAERPVVDVQGAPAVYPTTGQLRVTTVAVTPDVTLFGAVGMWASGDYEVVPREELYPPGQSEQQVDAQNTAEFATSESEAQAAAFSFLHYPTSVQVADVSRGSPADGRLQAGDRLLAVDGRPVTTSLDVLQAVGAARPGQTVVVRLARGAAAPNDQPVVVAARPDTPQRGFVGISAVTKPDVPFTVKISLGDVGGPSAGLMFALGVIDKLTPGDLAGGRTIAGTGSIDPSGQVGAIGGIRFKMTAARDAGASVFLVPAGNCPDAAREAPEGLTLARVGRLGDAVAALAAVRAGAQPVGC